jgi:hypothetical protein
MFTPFFFFLFLSGFCGTSRVLVIGIYSGFEGENRNELQARQCEPPGRVLEASVTASASATASAMTNSSSSAHAAFTGGLSNSKTNSRQGPPEVPSNSKTNPQTPSRTVIENLINYLKVVTN